MGSGGTLAPLAQGETPMTADYVVNKQIVKDYLDRVRLPDPMSEDQNKALMDHAADLLKTQGAKLVAHYYVDESIQALAESTGGYVSDSLDMARWGQQSDAQTLVVAGVSFMGETSKILSPEKNILMPELAATCSLDIGCEAGEYRAWRQAHPDRVAVVYANTSAAVKAEADWVVTSSIALEVVAHLHAQGQKVLWAPDKHLGRYVQQQTGADMVLWDGACIVHEEFRTRDLGSLRALYPEAAILVHPESPQEMVDVADAVGSTKQLIDAARKLPHPQLIVATDQGIFFKMRQAVPEKTLIAAPTRGAGGDCKSCAHCPWMGMNSLQKIIDCLSDEQDRYQIHVPDQIAQAARVSLGRMVSFQA